MKKIKYTFLALFVAAGVLTSCSDDDSDETIAITTTDVNATVDLLGNAVGEGSEVFFTVSLDQSFASDASIRVRLENDDTRTITTDVTLPAGSSSVSGSFFSPAGDVVETSTGNFNSSKLTAEGVLLSEPVVGQAYNIISNVVEVPLFDRAPEQSDDQLNVLFDWSNPALNDLDLYVFETTTFALASTSFSGSRYELGQILASAPDGTYGVNAEVWSNADSEIDYVFMYRNTTGELVSFTGSWSSVSGGDFLSPEPFITVTKSGDTFTIN